MCTMEMTEIDFLHSNSGNTSFSELLTTLTRDTLKDNESYEQSTTFFMEDTNKSSFL